MRINARLDAESDRQLQYLTAHTGASVSGVVRESLARYYLQLQAEKSGLRHFGQLVGSGASGQTDLSERYKALLAEGLEAKHRPPPK